MLLRVRELQDYTIRATDGDIGHVEQLYFDDLTWTIKYVVVDVGNWLSGRKVLIAPKVVIEADASGKNIHVSLTREEIQKGADIYSHKPVALQHPTDYSIYFGWPTYYWGLTGLGATGRYPSGGSAGTGSGSERAVDTGFKEENDPHLRSTDVVGRYHIMAWMVRLVISKILSSTIRRGQSCTLWQIQGIGGQVRRCCWLLNGSSG
jgi:hypothetical protein